MSRSSYSSDGPSSIHPSIIGLLRDLPPSGTLWGLLKKKMFLAVFSATIDWIYPTKEGTPTRKLGNELA